MLSGPGRARQKWGLPGRSASCTGAEVERSIAQGPSPNARDPGLADARPGTGLTIVTGLAIALLLFGIYLVSNPDRTSYYNHFVWQAEAFLDGRAAIRYPVPPGRSGPGNDQFQDVVPAIGPHGEATGYALVPFPPLPAVLLMPLVAIWGLTTDAQLVATIIGTLDVAIAFWVLGLLPIRPRVRVATTLFLGLGTVLWYAAELGTTWFLAHVVAVGFSLLAIGLALEADPRSARDDDGAADADRAADADHEASGDPTGDAARDPTRAYGSSDDGARAAARWGASLIDGRQFLAGVLFGLACTARLTVAFGAPFFVLVGGGGGIVRRGTSAAIGMALPIGALLLYTLVTTGHLLHPGYELLYRAEAIGYPDLGYRPDWAIEDPRYLVQHLPFALAGLPSIFPPCDPGAVRGLFNATCPSAVPRDIGMGLFVTSPAWLLALPAVRRWGRNRLVAGSLMAIVAIAVVDLMHFSQGWVQFGYRFSNDYAPFAIVLVALTLEAAGRLRWIGYLLIAASIAVNAWGVLWGHVLGW